MKKTDYVGIDYGHGITNINLETGIRNGVIPCDAVDFWNDESEPYYIDMCPHCYTNWSKEEKETAEEKETCPICNHDIDFDMDFDMVEPISWYIDNDIYSAETNNDCIDIFIVKSKYFTYAQFCSPCSPGACYLLEPLKDKIENNKCYCLGHDMFKNGAPYSVYNVETGKRVFNN